MHAISKIDVPRAGEAVKKLLRDIPFTTLLDIGCGDGAHTKIFRKFGKIVTATDYAARFDGVVEGMYQDLEFKEHDVTFASHVLEHQLDTHTFLRKMWRDTREGGYACITVPPLKTQIVGGHVSLWNAGLLMYRLVLAGFDCKNVMIHRYDYNITVIAQKKIFELPRLNYDTGDIELIAEWLPNKFSHHGFNGDIPSHNWH